MSENIKTASTESVCETNNENIVSEILKFMQLFICITLAKRILCALLLAVEVPNKHIAELVNLSERSVRDYKAIIESDSLLSLLSIRHGGGRKGKLAEIEDIIIEEIETNEYHNRRQIADMIQEKHGITVSESAVGKLLKKRH